jgi:transcriptional regulator with PAS, ATPase and Fis domain
MQENSAQSLLEARPHPTFEIELCSPPESGKARLSSVTQSERPLRADSTDALSRGAVRRFGALAAASPRMHAVFEALSKLAVTEITLTLAGETGTGKDVLAHAVHTRSPRGSGPFVVFDCGAVAPNLIESELFGHERGSFTGAVNAHAGACERAHGGTLFLDEIGELPLDLQPRLLRMLESRKVRRVGGTQDKPVDVRVIAATHRDLPRAVSEGRFRQDLFFRLAGAVVPVPALRSRLEDLPILVPRLLEDLGAGHLLVHRDTLALLAGQQWPGNVRELKNALACATAFVEDGQLEPKHLALLSQQKSSESVLDDLPLGGQTLECVERAAIKQTLAQSGGNKSLAARALGIATSTLYQKLKKHGI